MSNMPSGCPGAVLLSLDGQSADRQHVVEVFPKIVHILAVDLPVLKPLFFRVKMPFVCVRQQYRTASTV